MSPLNHSTSARVADASSTPSSLSSMSSLDLSVATTIGFLGVAIGAASLCLVCAVLVLALMRARRRALEATSYQSAYHYPGLKGEHAARQAALVSLDAGDVEHPLHAHVVDIGLATWRESSTSSRATVRAGAHGMAASGMAAGVAARAGTIVPARHDHPDVAGRVAERAAWAWLANTMYRASIERHPAREASQLVWARTVAARGLDRPSRTRRADHHHHDRHPSGKACGKEGEPDHGSACHDDGGGGGGVWPADALRDATAPALDPLTRSLHALALQTPHACDHARDHAALGDALIGEFEGEPMSGDERTSAHAHLCGTPPRHQHARCALALTPGSGGTTHEQAASSASSIPSSRRVPALSHGLPCSSSPHLCAPPPAHVTTSSRLERIRGVRGQSAREAGLRGAAPSSSSTHASTGLEGAPSGLIAPIVTTWTTTTTTSPSRMPSSEQHHQQQGGHQQGGRARHAASGGLGVHGPSLSSHEVMQRQIAWIERLTAEGVAPMVGGGHGTSRGAGRRAYRSVSREDE